MRKTEGALNFRSGGREEAKNSGIKTGERMRQRNNRWDRGKTTTTPQSQLAHPHSRGINFCCGNDPLRELLD